MGETGQGLATAENALHMAESLGLDELKVHALTTVGTAQTELNPETAERDLGRAVVLARAVNSPLAASALNNLSVILNVSDGRQARELQRDALEIAVHFGDAAEARFLRGNLVTQSFAVGDWADALPAADEFIAECEAGSPHYQEAGVRESRGFMRVARGDVEQGLDDVRRALRLARELDDPQSLLPGMVRFARVCLLAERGDEAVAVFSEALERAGEMRPAFWMLPEVGIELDRRSEVREVLASLQPSPIRTAGLAMLDGDFGRAAEVYETMGYAVFEADARVRAGRDLIESGRLSDGEAQLAKALAFYRSVRAELLVRRVQAQLPASA